MKGEKLLNILEFVEKTGTDLMNLLDAMTSGKSESYRKLRSFTSTQKTPFTDSLRQQLKERHRAQAYISYLKQDGLIVIKDDMPRLTKRGELRIQTLKERKNNALPIDYEISESNQVVLVIFDIPEKRKRMRAWLRSVLKNLGFSMIQKSVWFGKGTIPKELIDDFKKFDVLNHIEIFAITKTGSLKRV